MATTRTAKGTASLKASGTTLTISDVLIPPEHTLLVGVGFQGVNPPASVRWGPRDMNKIGQRIDTTANFGVSLWQVRVGNRHTRDIVATWSSSLNARCMFATMIDRLINKDDIARSLSALTSAPSVGPTGTLSAEDDFVIACFVSEGPEVNDTAGTPAAGWSAGQRVGTGGAPPVSNVTIQELYRDVTTADPVTASMTGATIRDWANIVVPLIESGSSTSALTMLSDYYERLAITNAASGGPNAIRVYMHSYFYNYNLQPTPSPEFLSDLGLSQTEYEDAIALLESEGVIEPQGSPVSGTMTPKGLEDI